MIMRVSHPCLGVALFFAAVPAVSGQWIEAKSKNYSILYQAGYEKDVEFARTWLGRAEDLLKSKYGVSYTGFFVSLYLYPEPVENADVGTATLRCCTNGANGLRTGTISFLAPSAPVWKGPSSKTSLGMPRDENYQAKVLLSEYITVGHYVVQESRGTAGGWRYYRAPEWFVQGLQEYDGIFHTTDANRNATAAALTRWAATHASAFSCCSNGLAISDVYNGGATFMAFLAAQFGEDIHARLLRDTAATFDEALKNQTKPYGLNELFDKFQTWLTSVH